MSWLEWYTRYAKYYHVLDGASIDYKTFAQKLDSIFKTYKVKKVLDFACGIGKLAIELKRLGYDVTGVDLSEAMLNEADLNAKKENVSFRIIEGDLRKDYIGKFDAILCIYNYIGHFSKHELTEIFHNFKRNLNKDGLIFFDIFNYKFMKENFKNDTFIDVSRQSDNLMVTRFNQNELDTKSELMRINQTTFIQDKTLMMHHDQWDLKVYTLEELKELLADGFDVVRVFGSIFGDSMLCDYSDKKECVVILGKLKD